MMMTECLWEAVFDDVSVTLRASCRFLILWQYNTDVVYAFIFSAELLLLKELGARLPYNHAFLLYYTGMLDNL